MMKRRLLFLDLDGVVNTHKMNKESGSCGMCPEQMNILNGLLKGSGIEIVIVSAWRYLILERAMTLTGFKHMMRSHGLRKSTEIIGITGPDQSDMVSDRGRLVLDFIDLEIWNKQFRKGVDLFVAIDDMDLGYTRSEVPFVKCDPDLGLTEENVEEARRILEIK